MVLVAAVRINGIVIPCWRHHCGYGILYDLDAKNKFGDTYREQVEEGFIDHRGDFLTREQAFYHAIECGQIPAELRHLKAQRGEELLYSEDLY